MRPARVGGGDLFAAGWLPPRAAAAALGLTLQQLEKRARDGELRHKQIAPGIWLYEVSHG